MLLMLGAGIVTELAAQVTVDNCRKDLILFTVRLDIRFETDVCAHRSMTCRTHGSRKGVFAERNRASVDYCLHS